MVFTVILEETFYDFYFYKWTEGGKLSASGWYVNVCDEWFIDYSTSRFFAYCCHPRCHHLAGPDGVPSWTQWGPLLPEQ